jgi:uncharacterized repeat protein (TIGR02543 family)
VRVTSVTLTADMTVYAKWSATADGKDYTLTFETNGGTSVAPVTAKAGTAIDLGRYATIKIGSTFEGWYANASLTMKVTSVTLTADTTVYAKWSATAVPPDFETDHVAYVIGYEDGTARPEANITRAEVATIFYRLLKKEMREANRTGANGFGDVDGGAWYNEAVSTLAKMGILKGYEDSTFRPNRTITRAEFAAVAARFESRAYDGPNMFADAEGHWAEELINRAAAKGWILGYEDGTFRPERSITRAEAMALINRVLHRLPEGAEDLLEGMRVFADNMDESKWYYAAVQEAANSHDYELKPNGINERWISLWD